MEKVDDPELGLLRRCTACDELWPDDEEFWEGPRSTVCRACRWERDARRRAANREHARSYRTRLRQAAV